ncbi:4Fe-4S_dicluster domain-containing protein [Hexamita inflata]|uniref:4Fe-4S dicluster domain-containing protein n=1 Tax=Hexamita inflata TaxID=28002 RepID=A0AA86Q6I8_9EUKA|nr:4Fe-4S dicluster domain-containing protein [Hexamita inflata]CAI9953324.1 4Fe-4S dicluster domain-containing protein [Hexamita inflata]
MSSNNFIKIDQEACIGCGACLSSCPQEALEFNGDGKSALITPNKCDGQGMCIDACPVQAISKQ